MKTRVRVLAGSACRPIQEHGRKPKRDKGLFVGVARPVVFFN